MKGRRVRLTIGERIAWYRRRRGLSQQVLAELVGRTEDWLSKVENNRIPLDRVSVINLLARELDVSLSDLLVDGDLIEWTPATGRRTLPALRDALLTYRQLMPMESGNAELQPVESLVQRVSAVWEAYQDARFGYMTAALPALIEDLALAVRRLDGAEKARCQRLLALTYQASTGVLTKLGEVDLACISAQRGYDLAEQVGERVVLTSLTRSVAHALLAAGRYQDAMHIIVKGSRSLGAPTRDDSRAYMSVFGTMNLTGVIAASRAEDRDAVREFLAVAEESAQRLGRDGNLLWTAFGPTNVAIHRVTAAMELGDLQQALTLGPTIDPSPLPVERQVRHHLEVARSYSARNDLDMALHLVLDAERLAPEQVRHHGMSRDLVLTWVRRSKGALGAELSGLATRLNVA